MKKIFAALITISALFSCQKVIDVDLNDADPKVVIEANYIGTDSVIQVRVNKTSSFFDTDPSQAINTADVRIYDQSGTETLVPFSGNGSYELNNYVPQYNTTYTLAVTTEGVTYTAQCLLPSTVQLQPIIEQYFPPGLFSGDGGYVVLLNFDDPADTTNFYEIIQGRNGIWEDSLSSILTQNDVLTDGNFVERPLFNIIYQSGDLAQMELRSVAEVRYNYLEQAQGAGDPSSAAPGNPNSNWDNGALGYFSAYSYSRQSLPIP
jgi:hypothetical protein